MGITVTEAKARLERMLQWQEQPALTTEEVDDLFEMAKIADQDGNAPDSSAWEPTFNLNAAAGEGWSWKAGKVASLFDADAGDAAAKRSQIFDMCMKKSAAYTTNSSSGSGGTGTTYSGKISSIPVGTSLYG